MSDDAGSGLSRRQMIAAGTTGLIAATAAAPPRAAARGQLGLVDGTPEQIHLTWGDDPARTMVVSWASPGRAERPRVRIGQRVIAAVERADTDTPAGAVSYTYHALVDGLRPGATYGYAVTADNDSNAADPFSATFTTAPEGRAAFRFTSIGDLATPGADRAGASGRTVASGETSGSGGSGRSGASGGSGGSGGASKAAYAVGAVEAFQPLFHLLNGDLADTDGDTRARRAAWRDYGNNVQASAAYRPWLPVPGSHEPEQGAGQQGLAAFLARYTLPSNGVDGFDGRWYAFRVGTALFVCLSGDDVADSAPAAAPGDGADDGEPPAPGSARPVTGSLRGYSGGAQTRWLESTLAAARGDASIDWIVVQLHPCACSSAPTGSGCDLGIRREWLPLFDTYEVDLVLSGHGHGYERSFPVRGFDAGAGANAATGAATDTRRPHPVTTVDSGVFDTSQGTVHLVLGCGGATPGPWPAMDGTAPAQAALFQTGSTQMGPTRTARVLDAVEAATWSARRDSSNGYGIAVFDVHPGGEAGGQTSITVRFYRADGADPAGPADPGDPADPAGPAAGEQAAPADDYALFETFTLVRPRSDGRRWKQKG